jgi:pyridoxine/pyridoxamine 5'-phosphate oxidase
MRLYLVAYQSHEAELVGAAIVEAFDQWSERAEAACIHQPGAMSVVTQVEAVPPDLIGRKLSPRDVKKLVTSGPK